MKYTISDVSGSNSKSHKGTHDNTKIIKNNDTNSHSHNNKGLTFLNGLFFERDHGLKDEG